jgi:2-methylcitrate dehydratase PrpD
MNENTLSSGSHTEDLIRLAKSISLEDLSPSVVHEGRRILVDCIATILAGATQVPILALAEQMNAASSVMQSRIVGNNLRAEAMWAALVNGTSGVWFGLDPGNRHAGGNPAIYAVSAGLAVADREGASGRRLLEAIIAGCEIGARVGAGTTLRPGMHPHGSWPVVGAATAAGLVMGYNEDDLRETLNMSTSLNLATSSKAAAEGANILSVYGGFGAGMGVMAADLVSDYFTAEKDGITSIFGEIAGVFFDTEKALEDIGQRWEIERGYHKIHACDRCVDPALDALIGLTTEKDFLPGDVERIDVSTYAMAATMNDTAPDNLFAARRSIPYAVASYLILKDSGLAAYSEKAFDDPAIGDLAARVSVREDLTLSQGAPASQPAVLTIKLHNGKVLEKSVVFPAGEYDFKPLDDDILSHKFKALAAHSLSPDGVAEMLDMLWKIETVDNVRLLIDL